MNAQKHFEAAIANNPNILAPYIALAGIYRRADKIKSAISQYETIIGKRPQYLPAYMALGTIYDQQGDVVKSETYYRKALEIKNDFAPAANNLAWNLADKGGNIDEALTLAQIAKEQMPKDPSVMDTLGWIYLLKGSYLNALSELQDAQELVPENVVVNYHLGVAYYKNNQPKEAKEFLGKALELDSNFKEASEAKRLLAELG